MWNKDYFFRYNQKYLLVLSIIIGILLLLLIGNFNYNLKSTGKVVEDDIGVSSADIQVAEQIAEEELTEEMLKSIKSVLRS